VAFSMAWAGEGGQRALDRLAGFRAELYRCFPLRGDVLAELGDAVLCAPGRVTDLAHLSLEEVFRRGHGALFAGVNEGRVEVARLRRAVAGLALPPWPDGRIRLAVDVTAWLRPDAVTSAGLLWCPVPGRSGEHGQVVPGWPYSWVAALGPGALSWAVLLDALRLGPGDDACAVTAAQIREVVSRLVAAGHWKPGDPLILVVLDAGYNPVRLARLLAGVPAEVVARVRSNRVFHRPAPPREYGMPGRQARHGVPVRCDDPQTWDGAVPAQAVHPRYGPLLVLSWGRVHQRLDRHCGGWEDWPPGQELPVIEGTLIRLSVPGRDAMWLWSSCPDAAPEGVAAAWQGYLRRFDIEHVFRFLKRTLGWDKPMLRNPAAADRWTWLILACWNQLWAARPLAAALKLPWQRTLPAAGLTPGRVRAGFPRLHPALPVLASPPKPSRPGPGRPKGSRNKTLAPRQPVGKTHPKPRRHKKKQAKQTNQTG
jgi:hypothetical protein